MCTRQLRDHGGGDVGGAVVDEPTRSGGLFICLPRASLPATPVAGFKCGRLICCMSYNVTTGVRCSSNVRLSYRIQQMRQQLRGSIPICIMADLSAARARGRVGGRPLAGSTSSLSPDRCRPVDNTMEAIVEVVGVSQATPSNGTSTTTQHSGLRPPHDRRSPPRRRIHAHCYLAVCDTERRYWAQDARRGHADLGPWRC